MRERRSVSFKKVKVVLEEDREEKKRQDEAYLGARVSV
jgi:hypothetical protein